MTKATLAQQLVDIFGGTFDEFAPAPVTVGGVTSDNLDDILSELQIASIQDSVTYVIKSGQSVLAKHQTNRAVLLVDGSVFYDFNAGNMTDCTTHDILTGLGFVPEYDGVYLGEDNTISIRHLHMLRQAYNGGAV